MISFVQVYIHIKTGKQVNIIIRNENDVLLLRKAYLIAINYFELNNIKLILLVPK